MFLELNSLVVRDVCGNIHHGKTHLFINASDSRYVGVIRDWNVDIFKLDALLRRYCAVLWFLDENTPGMKLIYL